MSGRGTPRSSFALNKFFKTIYLERKKTGGTPGAKPGAPPLRRFIRKKKTGALAVLANIPYSHLLRKLISEKEKEGKERRKEEKGKGKREGKRERLFVLELCSQKISKFP